MEFEFDQKQKMNQQEHKKGLTQIHEKMQEWKKKQEQLELQEKEYKKRKKEEEKQRARKRREEEQRDWQDLTTNQRKIKGKNLLEKFQKNPNNPQSNESMVQNNKRKNREWLKEEIGNENSQKLPNIESRTQKKKKTVSFNTFLSKPKGNDFDDLVSEEEKNSLENSPNHKIIKNRLIVNEHQNAEKFDFSPKKAKSKKSKSGRKNQKRTKVLYKPVRNPENKDEWIWVEDEILAEDSDSDCDEEDDLIQQNTKTVLVMEHNQNAENWKNVKNPIKLIFPYR
jgi:hypothetical protein